MTSTRPSPKPPKPVLLFAAHALALALLLGYWPSARAVHPPLFRLQCDLLFGSEGTLEFLPAAAAAGESHDTWVQSYAPGASVPQWRIGLSAVRMGYWPSAVLVALLLATPLSARRRLVAVLIGLLWLDAFALGRVGLEILRAFEELRQGGADAHAEGTLLLYRTASEVSNSNIVVIAAVLLAWVATARPRRNLALGALGRLLGVPAGSGPRGSGDAGSAG